MFKFILVQFIVYRFLITSMRLPLPDHRASVCTPMGINNLNLLMLDFPDYKVFKRPMKRLSDNLPTGHSGSVSAPRSHPAH